MDNVARPTIIQQPRRDGLSALTQSYESLAKRTHPFKMFGIFGLPWPENDKENHYSLIDFLRFVAAISVLIWHYQHFYFVGNSQRPLFEGRWVQPGYSTLSFFFENGHFAVWFFWAISGFVFASAYVGKPTTLKAYFVNRFSRLYPLHFATLLIVAALQHLSLREVGAFQVYQINDAYHFFLNLFFVSHWGFQDGFSFNAPIWSVSVEVSIYIVFFISLGWLFRFGLVGPLAFCSAFALVYAMGAPGAEFWVCGLLFYAGATAWVVIALCGDRHYVPLAVGIILLVIPFFYLSNITYRLAFLFSGAIMAASAAERSFSMPLKRPMRWLGDCTYGIYLWHIPVQISIMMTFDALGYDRAVVGSPYFFVFFIISTMIIARISFVYLENPARLLIRRRFLQKSIGP